VPPRNGSPRGIRTPAEQAFIVTVGVRKDRFLSDCQRVLSVLERYGFEVGPTTHDTFDTVAADHDLLPQLREVDTDG
jgi:predicted transcriptional regulator